MCLFLDIIEMELYLLAVVVLSLISLCVYRVKQNLNTERRNSSIFFLFIWIFTLVVVLFGLGGKYAPYHSSIAEILIRIGDMFTICIMLSMTFFTNSILYGTIYKEKKAFLIFLYVLIEGIVIVIFYAILPIEFVDLPITSFLMGETYNEITYSMHQIITIAYFPMILPILYVFINMGRIDPPNKNRKYRLYLIAFICAIIELAFDMPGTFPQLLFFWRLFAVISMTLVIIALLIPRVE